MMNAFHRLNPSIQKAIKKMGIIEPTESQNKAIPRILEGKNILLIAPTGIGKTEAAVLPIFHNLLESKFEGFTVLYITPLRALNRDMLRRMNWFSEELDITVGVRHGDTTQKERRQQVKNPPQILITTPETLQIMFTGRRLRKHLENVRWVVVDEIHELAQDERGAQLSIGLERLCHLAKRDFQRIGLSATVGSAEEVAKFLVGVDRNVEILDVSTEKRMKIHVTSPKANKKDEKLSKKIYCEKKQAACIRRCYELIKDHRSTLFFVNTRDTAEFLAARYRLWKEKFGIGIHHGSLSKRVRIQMEDDFKNEVIKALICTSSLELGIDIGAADFTIQYNSPRQVTRLIQRIGRAGHHIDSLSEGSIVATNEDEIAEGSVIARRALHQELEKFKIRQNGLSVLANQIAAFAMTGRKEIEQTYKIIRKAYPYRTLTKQMYLGVLDQLNDLRMIWLDDNDFGKTRNTLTYYYENISMIPDERSYRIVDISSRKPIATLDERFVARFGDLGTPFIVRGLTWKIVDFDEEKILVEQVKDIGTIPSWVGEEIPIPFEIAQEVGHLRRASNWEKYSMDKDSIELLRNYIKKQAEYPIPNDKLVTIEVGDRLFIINACFGSKVNETLGKIISSLLTAKLGESIGVDTDAYRIILEVPRQVKPDEIKEILLKTKPHAVEDMLRIVLRNSSYLRWQFLHVAKKFGVIRKAVDYRSISIKKLMTSFEDTPIFEEAIEKVLWERMDVENTAKILSDIQNSVIDIQITTISPIGIAGLKAKKELMIPQRADHSILMSLKKRLEDERVLLVCLNCKRSSTRRVKNLDKKIRCPVCQSVLIAALHPSKRKTLELLKRKALKKEEIKQIKRIYKNANLVMAHGKKAAFALVGRGVGVDTAARILYRYHEDEDAFLKDILAAEINYAKTKRFWD